MAEAGGVIWQVQWRSSGVRVGDGRKWGIRKGNGQMRRRPCGDVVGEIKNLVVTRPRVVSRSEEWEEEGQVWSRHAEAEGRKVFFGV